MIVQCCRVGPSQETWLVSGPEHRLFGRFRTGCPVRSALVFWIGLAVAILDLSVSHATEKDVFH